MAGQTPIEAACLCGASHFAAALPTSSLPRQARICHCNSCRHMVGTLCFIATEWPLPLPDTSTLSSYAFSDNVQNYFCSTCGSQMFWHRHANEEFLSVATGVLKNPGTLLKIEAHGQIADTKDGGFSLILPEVSDEAIPRWGGTIDKSSQLPLDWKAEIAEQSAEIKLPVYCLCKGVKFNISRPSSKDITLLGTFPNMAAALKGAGAKGVSMRDWWRVTGDRHPAGVCVCGGCRLASGVDIMQWAFVATPYIELPDGAPFHYDFGTLKAYRSSSEATRYFCSCCGATVFWVGDDRPQHIDVAVGLMDAASGARAEDWLIWRTSKVSHEEDAIHPKLLDALKKGLANRAGEGKPTF